MVVGNFFNDLKMVLAGEGIVSAGNFVVATPFSGGELLTVNYDGDVEVHLGNISLADDRGIDFNGNLFTGSYNELSDTPALANVATSGSYTDLINTIQFVPAGGIIGEYLVKDSSTDYDMSWTDRVNAKTIYENVKNVSGVSLTKGTPVYQVGISGNTITVDLARADDPSKLAIGVLDQTLADEAEGRMLVLGEITGVNTLGFISGERIYLAATGGYSNVAPTESDIAVQFLGIVNRISDTVGSGFITGTLTPDQTRWTGSTVEFWDGSDWVLLSSLPPGSSISGNQDSLVSFNITNSDDTGTAAASSLLLLDGTANPALFLKAGQAYDSANDNLAPGDATVLNIGGVLSLGSATNATTIFAGGTQDANVVATFNTDGTVDFAGDIEATVNGFEIGYRNMPQVSAGNVTLALADSGKHFYSTSANPTTITIPTNSNVAFATGSVVTIVNQGTGNITVGRETGANLYLGGNATIANRTITTYGVATLLKVADNTWFINGTGVI